MCIAVNLLPKVELSTMFWHFKYHVIGALLTKIKIPI